MDYTQLIGMLYNSHDATTLCTDAAEAIEALQAQVKELEQDRDEFYMSYRMQTDILSKSAIVDRDRAEAELVKLREQPTAKDYMTGYSDGKQWAMEQQATDVIDRLNAQLATTERCYTKCFEERAALEDHLESMTKAVAAAAKRGAV